VTKNRVLRSPSVAAAKGSGQPVRRYVIFNADDFGYSRGITRGIVEAHRNGLVTSTSLMVNTPATEHAVTLARELPELSVGLHVNFTNEAQRLIDFYDRQVARDELRRQLDRFVALLGCLPTHLDSHQHVHRLRECLAAFQELAAELGLHLRDAPPVRYKGGFYAQWEYGVSDSSKVSVEALERILRSEIEDGLYEMCVHPGYVDPEFESVYHADRELELLTLTHPRLRAVLAEQGIALIGYRDLARVLAETGLGTTLRLPIEELPGSYAVCRLPADDPWPEAAPGATLLSVTRVGDELSIVCPESLAPPGARVEHGWRCLRLHAVLDLSLVGVLADLTAQLARVGISVFVLSTHDTDLILVRAVDLVRAVAALRAAGYGIHADPGQPD
jgi:chitin disaccharide deacetylase